MVLLIIGIYAIVTAKFQVTRHYGLKGKGARVAGGVCLAFALGFFSILSIPILALSQALDLGNEGALVLGLLSQLVALLLVLIILVRIYGNAYVRTHAPAVVRNGVRASGNQRDTILATRSSTEESKEADRLRLLQELAGGGAVNFASKSETEWLCVCGTANQLDKGKRTQNCSRCNRNRDYCLEHFSVTAIESGDAHHGMAAGSEQPTLASDIKPEAAEKGRYPKLLLHINWIGPISVLLFRKIAGELIRPASYGSSATEALAIVTRYSANEQLILTICRLSFIPLIIILIVNWSNIQAHKSKVLLILGSILTLGLGLAYFLAAYL
jgi:hypothetical protein